MKPLDVAGINLHIEDRSNPIPKSEQGHRSNQCKNCINLHIELTIGYY
jgi:hypothetical protein